MVVNGTSSIQNLSAAKTVVLRGIDFVGPGGSGMSKDALTIANCMGQVHIEDASSLGGAGFVATPGIAGGSGLRITNCSGVTLMDCEIVGGSGATPGVSSFDSTSGGGDGVTVTGSGLALFDSTAVGGHGGSGDETDVNHIPASPGGHGILIDGGTLFVSGSSLFGGNGGNAGDLINVFLCVGPPFGYSGGSGGDALRATGNAVVRAIDEGARVGGAGGAGGLGCCGPITVCQFPSGAQGQQTNLVAATQTLFAAPARHYTVSSPVREGETAIHSMQGIAHEQVFLMYAVSTQFLWVGGLKGTFLMAGPFGFIPLGATNFATGKLSFDGVVPELGPGFEGFTIYFQVVFGGVNGSAYLGPMSAQLLLDSGF